MRPATVTPLTVPYPAGKPAAPRPPARHSEPVAVAFRAIGTVVSVLVTEPGRAAEAGAILRAELADVDAACSRFRADSELSRLNKSGAARSRSAAASPAR